MTRSLFSEFKKIEFAFLNSAYLSELWAVNDLLRFKKEYPNCWGLDRESQLIDEIKHANLLLNYLKDNNSFIIKDTKYSMQERLYRRFFNLGQTENMKEFSTVHEMSEERAVWIYKTFLKINPESPAKSIINEILMDEKNHFKINDIVKTDTTFFLKGPAAVDKLLFRGYLPEKYGHQLFYNESFWVNYYDLAMNV